MDGSGDGFHTPLNSHAQTPQITVDLIKNNSRPPDEHDHGHTENSGLLPIPSISCPFPTFEYQSTAAAGTRSQRTSISSVGYATTASRNPSNSIVSRTSATGMSDPDYGTFPVHGSDIGGQSSRCVQNDIYSISAEALEKMLEGRSIDQLRALGGVHGLAKSLLTDLRSGINYREHCTSLNGGLAAAMASEDTYAERRRMYGDNRLPVKKGKSIFQLMWITFNDKVLILLTVVAAISLAMGLYQTFSRPHKPGEPKVEWVEGATILTAVLIVVIVGGLNDYQKEKQFVKLNKKKEDRVVNALRAGKPLEISIYDVVVGDILYVAPGDLLPADGILVSGHNVRCDESSVTGEADQKTKTPGNVLISEDDYLDPFLVSGTKVLEGIGTYMVTGVGINSVHGKLMMSLTDDVTEPTLLQQRLTDVANRIATAGVSVAIFLFLVLLIKFLADLGMNIGEPSEKGDYIQAFLRITIVSITVVVIAVPEGLPLAVTLALAFAVTRMLKNNNLVRILSACETMGNATTICCDKTGTLTTNNMTAVGAVIGITHQFGSQSRINEDLNMTSLNTDIDNRPMTEIATVLPRKIRGLISQLIVINSTAFESEENGKSTLIGSRTETALLSFARDRLGLGPVALERAGARVVMILPFDSKSKYMATLVDIGGIFRMYVKGAPEILLARSARVTKVSITNLEDTIPLDNNVAGSLRGKMEEYSNQSLRMIGVAYRDFPSWPLPGHDLSGSDLQDAIHGIVGELTFLGLFAIQDPVRPGVPEAVARCQRAGISVRMVTGDNVGTARAIGKECGILTDGLVLEGPEFRALSAEELHRVIPKLQILARSSPEDKRILVKALKQAGEIVAVTGDGTNDGPALRAADVSFSMGVAGTEIAREASSIILLDDNFSSIVKAIEWGRAVNDSVKKFLQFQLTVNITAVALTCVSALTSKTEESILTPVQLLWVNLIMDTFAALALATDPPTPSILDRKPEPKASPLISLNMWKMIISQAVYQLVIVLVLNYAGKSLFGHLGSKDSLETLIFNTYVWMQFFNQFNNRRLDNKLNVFDGVLNNWYFLGINLITVSGQALIISFGGSALSAVRQSAAQWGIAIALGAFSLVIGIVTKLIPNELIRDQWSRTSRYSPLAPDEPVDDGFV